MITLPQINKRRRGSLLFILLFLLGVFLLIYPTFSNWWNERHQSRAIASYDGTVAETNTDDIDAMLAAAEAYNEQLLVDRENETLTMGILTDEQREEYDSLLDVSGTGIMGYIRIPKIDVELPIYHGTDEAVLQIAVGHIEGTSLPIGGKGTHAVLSGHTGLPSATLFTYIDNLGIGDVFMITCLNRKVTYEVDQIETVLPSELDNLEIDPDQDYCTLVTCTPYGVNSHRLLVRGHRIENLLDDQVKTIQIEIPEHELSMQEKIQNILLPYALILAAGFLGLALILPARKPRYSDGSTDGYRGGNRGQRRRDDRSRDNRRQDDRRYGDHSEDDRDHDVRRNQDPWEEYYDQRDDERIAQQSDNEEPEFYDDDDVGNDDNGGDEFYDD